MKKHILSLSLLILSLSSLRGIDLVDGRIDPKLINMKKGEIPLRIENRSSTPVVWVILNRTGAARAYCIGDIGSTFDLVSRGAIKDKNKREVGRIPVNNAKEVSIARGNNIKKVKVRYEGLGVKSTNYTKEYEVFLGIEKSVGLSGLRSAGQHIYKIGIEIYDNYIVVKKYVINNKDVKDTKGVK